MPLEWWKAFFEIGGVALLALTFAFGAGALIVNSRLSAVQDAQLRQFDKDLTGAKTELGEQQERAANADARVAGLEQAASNAKAAQQQVETELAKQRERTAKAEQAASDAALALAKFKAPRSLSLEQQDKLVANVKPFAGQNFAFAVFPDPEPQGTRTGY